MQAMCFGQKRRQEINSACIDLVENEQEEEKRSIFRLLIWLIMQMELQSDERRSLRQINVGKLKVEIDVFIFGPVNCAFIQF